MRLFPRTGRGRTALAGVAALGLIAPVGWMWQASLVPDTYDAAEMGYADYGGGPRPATGGHAAHGHGHHGTGDSASRRRVAQLTGDTSGAPDVHEELTVARAGDRITVNGTTPGPTVRAVQGDLVEVVLHNDNVADGATLHWHGIDVPNAMDGVAGITQDAVAPGEEFTYRFVAERAGTYWYHAHQVSHEQVRSGLLGAVVILPRDAGKVADHDEVAVLHRYGSTPTLNGETGTRTIAAAPGDVARIRVVNTDNALMPVWVSGASYRVLAVDGTDLHEPGPVHQEAIVVTAGARVDLEVEVPADGARVEFGRTTALVLGTDPTEGEGTRAPREFVDLLSYGAPAASGLDATDPDREFTYRIGRRLGFLDGRPGWWWTINGHLYPDVPMFHVVEGDRVVMHIENRSGESHPMHLHGHHALVLARNGEPATGSPWWVDSLEVAAGDDYDIAFVADNPGIWMDHCHNLPHAQQGLVTHLMYVGVGSSYRIGGKAGNEPE